MGTNKNEFIISKPNLEDAIHIWNRASITLLDIRHNLISPQDSLLQTITIQELCDLLGISYSQKKPFDIPTRGLLLAA
ncbi:MAG: hypothetical protein K0R05_1224 [Anaerocolumna sp.]|jgi:hypothetical protein|nr:hypothetical protein [Anaerocolumna sp.]